MVLRVRLRARRRRGSAYELWCRPNPGSPSYCRKVGRRIRPFGHGGPELDAQPSVTSRPGTWPANRNLSTRNCRHGQAPPSAAGFCRFSFCQECARRARCGSMRLLGGCIVSPSRSEGFDKRRHSAHIACLADTAALSERGRTGFGDPEKKRRCDRQKGLTGNGGKHIYRVPAGRGAKSGAARVVV